MTVVSKKPLIPYEQLNEPFFKPERILVATTLGSSRPDVSAIAFVSSGYLQTLKNISQINDLVVRTVKKEISFTYQLTFVRFSDSRPGVLVSGGYDNVM